MVYMPVSQPHIPLTYQKCDYVGTIGINNIIVLYHKIPGYRTMLQSKTEHFAIARCFFRAMKGE